MGYVQMLFIYLFMYLFIHLFMYLFIYLCIYNLFKVAYTSSADIY